ncbi:Arc-like DNA binding domain-containing protein [Pseudomonas kuykendallii]|uniref:Arc-like DNA binding domain-containing protein n=1 Tax=Pseudomonas kuykendallii TaxID=1007099 RepID=A0A1H3AF85_9PSED|nr:Arc family DNA-binding protein [Pseudomonas kuykendallii]SDX27968.1 Arc-like DNA binding domain-containing protein [Pseudomonas kuykendallii]
MSRADHQFKLRMPAELRTQVEKAAWLAHRSINAELVFRLTASFAQEQPAETLTTAPALVSQERSA